MRKLFIVATLCVVNVIAFAQIPVIQPQESQFEFCVINKGTTICYDKESGEYELIIHSDNQFEEKTANISLGKSVEEALTSLINLKNVMKNANAEFELYGYQFRVGSKNTIFILRAGKLDYSAGNYLITDSSINSSIKYFIAQKGAPVGDGCKITTFSTTMVSGMFYINVPLYEMKPMVFLDMASRGDYFTDILEASEGYELTNNDIIAIKESILKGRIKDTDDVKFFLKVAESILKR